MASESAVPPVNGSYGAPHYNAAELPAHNPAGLNGSSVQTPGAPSSLSAAGDSSDSGPSKDEVGWFFVEQYYTTLSKNPEKLPLFYNKKSQLVFGNEADKAPVSVGQKAIGERIKEIGVEDCKVRVTNVDSQESQDKSIVIQVIGEMSNKNEPHKKYVQTFVLAKQQNGYYVLNDIFRYIAEDDDDEAGEPPIEPEPVAAPVAEPEIKTLPSSDDLAEVAKGAEVVNQKLEQSADTPPTVIAGTNGALSSTAPSVTEPSVEAPEEAEEPDDAPAIELEVPKEPEPTPAPPTPEPQEATPVEAKDGAAALKPSAPKTWASMFSGGKVATPVIPAVPSSATATATTTTQPKKSPAPTAPTAARSVSTATPPIDDQPLPSPGGWQTAGQEHKGKINRGQSTSISTTNGRDGSIKAYIKNVTEKVDGAVLKATLAKYGKLEYFDISRQKNCAFVEFADQAGFSAAAAANPHTINGEDVFVEERHIRTGNAYGGFNRGNSMRGRGNMDSRNNSQGGRGGFNKDGGRGNFTPRGGRGGSISSRGRGMPQAA